MRTIVGSHQWGLTRDAETFHEKDLDALKDRFSGRGEWLDEPSSKGLHAIEKVTTLHARFMSIFPWAKESGRTARIVSNLLLQEGGYPLAVIHSIDRQRYYESLKGEPSLLLSLYLEAVQNTAENELRLYEEAEKAPPRKRKRA